jgi:TolB-like protein
MTDRAHRAGLGAAALAACLTVSPLPAQSRPVVLAILPFGDRGSFGQDREVFEALQLGIPATIAGELGSHSELRLADPARVSQALRAQKMDPAGRLDAASAARIGKAVGARYAITGSFADFYGKFRLDARIVDVESGQILKVVSNSDSQLQDRTDLYRIIQRVGHKVLAEANPSAAAELRETEGKTIPTGALTEFSLGLLAESRADSAKAAQHYGEALSRFPNYPEAREGLRRIRGS